MKQILIRHTDDVSKETALRCAYLACDANKRMTGVVTFKSGIVVEYSSRSKYPSMTVYREEKK